MVNPYAYPCNHYICENCLKLAIDKHGSNLANSNPLLIANCPICGTGSSKRSIIPDYNISKIIEQSRELIKSFDPHYEEIEEFKESEEDVNNENEQRVVEPLKVGDLVNVLPR